MSYFLAHLDDQPDIPWNESDPREEIYVMPYGQKVIFPVAIGSLRKMLPFLHEQVRGLGPACCPDCGARLPAPTAEDSQDE